MTPRSTTGTALPELPPRPEGWRSAAELERMYPRGRRDINRILKVLRQRLINDISHSAGTNPDDAALVVDTHLIGRKRSRRGRAALAASPDAQRLLDLPPRTTDSPKPGKWLSAAELTRVYRGDHRTIGRRLE